VTLFNTAPANVTYTETLASNGFSSTSSNFTATGSVSGIAGGSSGSGNLTVGLGSGLAVGVVSGTTSLALNSNAVNSSGLGTTALTAQTITITGQVYSGNMVWNGSSGNYGTDSNWNDASNAGVHVAPGLDAGFTTVDSATFGNTSGSVTVTFNGSSPSLNAVTFNNTGSYALAQGSGGSITLAGTTPSITANGTHAISAPITLAADATMNVTAGSNLAVSGVIGETGGARSLTKGGTGTLALSGNNTYSGPTNVTAGTLLANNTSGSATGSGNVTVAFGATLGGIGTTGGATTIAGILSPGDGGIGTLNITGNVTWQGASSNGTATDWIFQLGASPTSDLLNITGDFLNDTGAGTNFRFNFEGVTNTGTFKVVDWSGTSSFIASDFRYTNLGSGLSGSFSINGSQLDFSVLPAVPEPSTWVAMAALIITGGTMAMHRRTRQARFFRNPKSARKNAGRRERGSTNDIGKGGASPSAPLLWQRGCRGRHPSIDCAYARIRGNGRLLTGDTSACRIVLF
jgi:autotransporter-associated beta strand protein